MRIWILLMTGLALIGCAGTAPAPTAVSASPGADATVDGLPTVASTPEPTAQPPVLVSPTVKASGSGSATATMPARPSPTAVQAGGRAYSDPALGISFTYPSNWEILPRSPESPAGVTLHAPPQGSGPEPVIFAITVDEQTSSENSLDAVVEQQLAQVPEELRSGIEQRSLTVGGEPGEEIIGLPSQAGALETLVLHKGQLYLIILQPYDENNDSLRPLLAAAKAAYDQVLSTFKFLT